MSVTTPHTPTSTYRLQLSNHLTFAEVQHWAPYLNRLGVGALYFSPICRAVGGSTHGYDIVDPEQFDPSLGSDEDFIAMAEDLRARQMGLVVDVVPNHMGIDDTHNRWWRDVLMHGESSAYARYFDIDWMPPKPALHGKVLLAVLGEQFGQVLEQQQLQLRYANGEFTVDYYERSFPTDPRTWSSILARVRAKLVAENASLGEVQHAELSELIDQLLALPPHRESSVENIQVRRESTPRLIFALDLLMQHNECIRSALEAVLAELNGVAGDSPSFDALEEFLNDQSYRLSYWRVATEEINYRRFFDVNTLAAIRVEDDEVFDAVHRRILKAVSDGHVTGLRIDHADGLRDPQRYLATLTAVAHPPASVGRFQSGETFVPAPPYLVVEKILGSDESLREDWLVQGTTGYDLMNTLVRVMVDPEGMKRLREIYERFAGNPPLFTDVLYSSKLAILTSSLSSEVYVLSQQLGKIAEQHRSTRDFTRATMHRALREVVACFPVYRTYYRPGDTAISDEDRQRVQEAVRWARRRNPATSPTFFDFIGSVLLLEDPPGISEENRTLRREFVLKFQQVTGPVMAKGMEDTAFYRFYPLLSLNEVGGSPVGAPLWAEQFHNSMVERAAKWPQSMSATATHDTKRGEDVRARLNVLSEVPTEWESALLRWREMNAPLRSDVDGSVAPSSNEEHLIYQTLLGTWPVKPTFDGPPDESYLARVLQYLQKALREAKQNTSWLNPQPAYEEGVQRFVERLLDPLNQAFIENFDAFARSIADAGFVNSLSQLVLKLGVPGVPDTYQGCELWDFSLVDPDNRRPVDFARRSQMLDEIDQVAEHGIGRVARELLPHWPDERLKLLVTAIGLRLRRDRARIFSGGYLPLAVTGDRANHVCAFVRSDGAEHAVFVVPRFVCHALREFPLNVTEHAKHSASWPPSRWWQTTELHLPPELPTRWRHLFSGDAIVAAPGKDGGTRLHVDKVFASFPVAILMADE